MRRPLPLPWPTSPASRAARCCTGSRPASTSSSRSPQYAARRQSLFIRDGLAALPARRERFVGSVDVTWRAFQQPQSRRALTEIIIATRHDAELAAHIPGFAHHFEAGIARGAARFAEALGLTCAPEEAVAERRLVLVALRGLAVATSLSGEQSDPEAVLSLLRRVRADFYDRHAPR